jgi:uncharacterized repeat protein (TIGR01451 family)
MPLSADLEVEKTGTPSVIHAGDTLTYVIKVSNLGPAAAQNVVLEDIFPSELEIISVTPSMGSWNFPEWELGTLAAGEFDSLIVVARVSPSLSSSTTIVNNVVVTSSTFDPDLSNNSDDESTTVHINSDVSIDKTGSPKPATIGECIPILFMW